MKRLMNRIDRVCEAINIVLLMFAIGLAVLDATVLVTNRLSVLPRANIQIDEPTPIP